MGNEVRTTVDKHGRPVPCEGEGDVRGCDWCWCMGGGDTIPYCASTEYRILRAELGLATEWISWCGEWAYGPFPDNYADHLRAREVVGKHED